MSSKALFGIVAMIIAGAAGFIILSINHPGKFDRFAECVKNQDTHFYGAFWCSHCQNQKSLFGKSARLLPYVECSTPDGRSQLELCVEAKINMYPTWIFADGTRIEGEVSLATLSEKTTCPLSETVQ